MIPPQAQPSVQAPPPPLALALAAVPLPQGRLVVALLAPVELVRLPEPARRAQAQGLEPAPPQEPVELGLELSKREQPERAPLLAPLEPALPQVPERLLPKVWPFAHCRRTRLQTPKPRRLPLGTMNYALF